MKINQMNEYVSWFLMWAIGCTGCNIFLFVVLLNFEELKVIQVVLIGLTVLWWFIFLLLYIKNRNILKNARKIKGTIIGESFKVIFLEKSEFIVRAMVLSDEGKVFHSYTGVYLLDYIEIKKKKINLPCTILLNNKQKKQAIIYFKDALLNIERNAKNQPIKQQEQIMEQ
ncbi:MAG: hypothetical protein NC089_03240 [Bacteroides sp.]|nr:hypothetical protein [Bacteroides sp.]MCM1549948.1 hypothetical protein [Clostridium sp.]